MNKNRKHPIGIFDSGLGGLSIFKAITKKMPRYDYVYMGDNARSPYGTRSFDIVYQYTLEAVKKLFELDCWLVVLACNTASAKALRTIQQNDLPLLNPSKRVLGVIRPSVEKVNELSRTKHVGIFGTEGTIDSNSYQIEIKKLFPHVSTYQQACPMWVPLVENNEFNNEGADYFVKKYIDILLSKSDKIDTVILGCTHYPFLIPKIKKYLPPHVNLIAQDQIIADSLSDYLKRHSEIESRCLKNRKRDFYTTGSTESFDRRGGHFLGMKIESGKIDI